MTKKKNHEHVSSVCTSSANQGQQFFLCTYVHVIITLYIQSHPRICTLQPTFLRQQNSKISFHTKYNDIRTSNSCIVFHSIDVTLFIYGNQLLVFIIIIFIIVLLKIKLWQTSLYQHICSCVLSFSQEVKPSLGHL